MKKIILAFILSLSACIGYAQTPAFSTQDNYTNYYRFHSYLGVDSGFLLPQRDTLWSPSRPAIVFRSQDSSIYLFNGQKWWKIGQSSSTPTGVYLLASNFIDSLNNNRQTISRSGDSLYLTFGGSVSMAPDSTLYATRYWVSTQGFLTTEVEPKFTGSAAATISTANINSWNNAFVNGSYNAATDTLKFTTAAGGVTPIYIPLVQPSLDTIYAKIATTYQKYQVDSIARGKLDTGNYASGANTVSVAAGSSAISVTGGTQPISTNPTFIITPNNTMPLWNAVQLQGLPILNTAPSAGQVLFFNGTSWAPYSLNPGSGTVTSVGLNAGYGTVVTSNTTNPVTSVGTFTVRNDTSTFAPNDNKASQYRMWGTVGINTQGYLTLKDTAHYALQIGDSALGKGMIMPIGDTVSLPPTKGGFVFNLSDSSLYFSNGHKWLKNSTNIDTVKTITQLEEYNRLPNVNLIYVTDSLRGGLFYYSSTGMIDTGIVFPSIRGNFWIRSYNKNNPINYLWYPNLQDAINSPYVSNLQIGSKLSDITLINQNIILKSNLNLIINGTLFRNVPNNIYSLTADAPIGSTTLTLPNANSYFQVGDKIGVRDTTFPRNNINTDGDTSREFMDFYITAVTSSSITINKPTFMGVRVANEATVFRADGMLVGNNLNNVNISGNGVIDFDGANYASLRGDPLDTINMEDIQANSCLSFLNSNNISISGIDVKTAILHNIALQNCNNVSTNSIYSHNAIDKNFLEFGKGNNFNIFNSKFANSTYEDGIIFHRMSGNAASDSIIISNSQFTNNGRYGIFIDTGINIFINNSQFIGNAENCKILSSNNIHLNNLVIDSTINPVYLTNMLGVGAHLYLMSDNNVYCNGLSFNNISNSTGFIYLLNGGNNIQFNNTTFSNLNNPILPYTSAIFTSNSSGNTALPTNFALSNSKFINVDSVQIYRYGSSTLINGNNASSNEIVNLDVPNYSTLNVERNFTDGTNNYFTGNIGIGVTNPSARFEIGDKSGINGGDFYSMNSITSPRFIFGRNTSYGNAAIMQYNLPDSSFVMYDTPPLTYQFILRPNGNVGIGTATPNATFNVNGSTEFDLGSDATGDLLYRSSNGNLSRLGIGTTGQVLTVSDGLPSWNSLVSSTNLANSNLKQTISTLRNYNLNGGSLTFVDSTLLPVIPPFGNGYLSGNLNVLGGYSPYGTHYGNILIGSNGGTDTLNSRLVLTAGNLGTTTDAFMSKLTLDTMGMSFAASSPVTTVFNVDKNGNGRFYGNLGVVGDSLTMWPKTYTMTSPTIQSFQTRLNSSMNLTALDSVTAPVSGLDMYTNSLSLELDNTASIQASGAVNMITGVRGALGLNMSGTTTKLWSANANIAGIVGTISIFNNANYQNISAIAAASPFSYTQGTYTKFTGIIDTSSQLYLQANPSPTYNVDANISNPYGIYQASDYPNRFSGGIQMPIRVVTGSTTVTTSDYTVVSASGTNTFTIPAASTCGRQVFHFICNTGTVTLSVGYLNYSGTNTTTIAAGSGVTIQSNGTSYYQIGQ